MPAGMTSALSRFPIASNREAVSPWTGKERFRNEMERKRNEKERSRNETERKRNENGTKWNWITNVSVMN